MTRHPRTTDTRKLYGQNFLRPGPLVARLVGEADIVDDDTVVEVGGGSGVLTRELAATGCRLMVVERDPQYGQRLAEEFGDSPRVSVVRADIRDLRWPSHGFRVFANIPFGLTTDIMKTLLDDGGKQLQRADLIVQHEVAKKRTGAPKRNQLSLGWAPWWTMRLGHSIPAARFSPRPRVDAAIIAVERRTEPLLPWSERPLWLGLLDEGFRHGRDPARRAFRSVLTGTQLKRFARTSRLELDRPATQLSLDQWLALHSVVREHAPPERWPRASRGHRAPRQGGRRATPPPAR